MIRHRCACGFHDAFGIDSVVRGDGLPQRRIAIAVVAVNFERLQIHWQFAKRKWRDAAGREIEPCAALRLGPIHVIGMFVSHTTFILVLVLLLVIDGEYFELRERRR